MITSTSQRDRARVPSSLWDQIRLQAEWQNWGSGILKRFVEYTVLSRESFEESLAAIISLGTRGPLLPAEEIAELALEVLAEDPNISLYLERDLRAVVQRDPATPDELTALLHRKGFHSLALARISHRMWITDRKALAYLMQSRASQVYGVDIHPAASLGYGLFVDHGTGLVIGETSSVGNNVSILHEVTLGGTGKDVGDRHPKVESHVLIGAGAKILGNITIGSHSKIGAGSVVLADVEPHTTVAGIPARPVKLPPQLDPANAMRQEF